MANYHSPLSENRVGGNYSGGYQGGYTHKGPMYNLKHPIEFTKMLGASVFTSSHGDLDVTMAERPVISLVIGVTVIILFILLVYVVGDFFVSLFTDPQGFTGGRWLDRTGSGSNNLGFGSVFTGTNQKDSMTDSSRSGNFIMNRDGFLNSREKPYYPDATNHTLRFENREKAAIRALGKINHERLRRSDIDLNAPLKWEPFYAEWKKNHPIDGESRSVEGMHGEPVGLDPNELVPY